MFAHYIETTSIQKQRERRAREVLNVHSLVPPPAFPQYSREQSLAVTYTNEQET